MSLKNAGIAQLVERHLAKVAVDGSSPFARSIFAAGIAQLVERHLAKVAVDGSSPFARSTLGRMPVLNGILPFL